MELKIDAVGLDMDGVLVDLQGYQFSKGIPYFCEKFQLSSDDVIKNINAYDIEEIFGCTREERMTFWKRYIWEYCLLVPAREGASDMTLKWQKEGRKVDIITSRVYVMQDDALGALFRLMVKIWLKKNRIHYDRIRFCSEDQCARDKSQACHDFGTKLMVDDKIENLLEIRKNILTACYIANWNKELKAEDIPRVNSFDGIDEYIYQVEKEKQKIYM